MLGASVGRRSSHLRPSGHQVDAWGGSVRGWGREERERLERTEEKATHETQNDSRKGRYMEGGKVLSKEARFMVIRKEHSNMSL